ncbi:MAG: hypothetical protein ACE37K_15580 [Planctomycetota bacterium]
MDEDRKIRFLVSPLVFVASFLWGLALDTDKSVANVFPVSLALPDTWQGSVALLAAGGSGVFTLGVAIGSISFVVLRAGFCIFCLSHGRSHEVVMRPDVLRRAWAILGGKGVGDPRREVYIGVSLDHGVIQSRYEGIHKWIRRRWNAFSISVTSITAIALSLIVAVFAGVDIPLGWWGPALAMTAVFVFSARWAWIDSMEMLALMTEIDLSTGSKKPSSEHGKSAASDA